MKWYFGRNCVIRQILFTFHSYFSFSQPFSLSIDIVAEMFLSWEQIQSLCVTYTARGSLWMTKNSSNSFYCTKNLLSYLWLSYSRYWSIACHVYYFYNFHLFSVTTQQVISGVFIFICQHKLEVPCNFCNYSILSIPCFYACLENIFWSIEKKFKYPES